MTGQMLRTREPGRHARVTNVELFFDLVFVFAVTQLSHGLLGHLNLDGALQAMILMLAVWWAWVYTAWVTNWLDPDHYVVRGLLFVLTGLGLVLSTSAPEAFESRAVPFAFAYVTFQVGRSLFMVWAGRADRGMRLNFVRISAWLIASGVFWILGAYLDTDQRVGAWGMALLIEYLGPATAFWTPGLGRTPTSHWDVEGAHMAERCGLFIIICLGESMLMTGAAFAASAWEPAPVAAFVAGLAGAIAMWWIYFNAHADAAARAIELSADPGRMARHAYTYAHLPLVAGIIVTAAGDELAVGHPLWLIAPPTLALIVGGPAIFLAGGVWFKHSVFKVVSAPRVGGLGLLTLVALASPWLTALTLSAAVSLVLAVVAAWETVSRPQGAAEHQVKV